MEWFNSIKQAHTVINMWLNQSTKKAASISEHAPVRPGDSIANGFIKSGLDI